MLLQILMGLLYIKKHFLNLENRTKYSTIKTDEKTKERKLKLCTTEMKT